MALPDRTPITEADYLALEATSETKHEYANGEILAMTGASWNHNVICMNVGAQLNVQLADRNCTVTSNDLRLNVQSTRSYRYPDVMVICGEPQFVNDRTDTINNPIVVIEVLSEGTEIIDRDAKLHEYLQIDTVQEYLLIAQSEAKIERYLRQQSGDWLYSRVTELSDTLTLPSIDCTLKLADLYNKVTLSNEDE